MTATLSAEESNFFSGMHHALYKYNYRFRCAVNPRHKRRQGFSTYMNRPCPHMCGHNHFNNAELMNQQEDDLIEEEIPEIVNTQ